MDFSFHLFFTLSGQTDIKLPLYQPVAGDVVTYETTTITTFKSDPPPSPLDSGFDIAFSLDPTQYINIGTGHHYDVPDQLIVDTDNYDLWLSQYEADRVYSAANTYTHFDNTPNPNKSSIWFPGSEDLAGDVEYLMIRPFNPLEVAYTPDYFFMKITISNPNRNEEPDVPTQFTEEQKDKFLADAAVIDKLTGSLKALGSSLNPLSAPVAGLNWLIDEYMKAAEPTMAPASVTAQSMPVVMKVAKKLTEKIPGLDPVSKVLGIATSMNEHTSDLLKLLAQDPPDLNYFSVLDYPHDGFEAIDGVSAAGNALLEDMYKMVGDLVEMLAAAERFQGADFVNDDLRKAQQEAAFDAALSAYNQRRLAVADALEAFLAEAALTDMNFADDSSLTQAASFFGGLTDLTDDPVLNEFVTGTIDSYLPSDYGPAVLQALVDAYDDPGIAPLLGGFPPLTLLGDDILQQIQDAIANAPASPFTGSVLGALDDVIASLSTEPPPPPADGPEVAVTGNGVDIVDGDTIPNDGDHTDFGLHAVNATVERTFTVTNEGTEELTTTGLKLPKGFKIGTDKLVTKLQPGQSDTFSVVLDTKKAGTFGGVATFKTNDPDEADFDFTIAATVAAPEIDVLGNGVNILDNDKIPGAADHTDFGSAAFGDAPVVRTFTINNTGGIALNIANVVVPAGFTLVGGFPATVAANSSATIQVQLDTDATGPRKGDIVITSNDSNEAAFNFTVQGSVTPQPVPGDTSDNTFYGQAHAEAFAGGDGSDTVSYAGTGAVIASLLNPAKNTGFAAGDTYDSIENLVGCAVNDTLTGNAANNILEGGPGADKLDGGSSSKADIDTASYANGGAVVADLLKSKNNQGDALGDTYKNIENLLGSAFDDTLTGNAVANALTGGAGDDTLTGNGGIDALTGGADSDTFVFNAIKDGGGATSVLGVVPPPTGDLITDFLSGTDVIGISRKGFKIAATLDEATFQVGYLVSETGVAPTAVNQTGVTATAAHGQFLFNQTTDQLWWDEDGAGAKKAVLLATFTNGAHVTAADFDLI